MGVRTLVYIYAARLCMRLIPCLLYRAALAVVLPLTLALAPPSCCCITIAGLHVPPGASEFYLGGGWSGMSMHTCAADCSCVYVYKCYVACICTVNTPHTLCCPRLCCLSLCV